MGGGEGFEHPPMCSAATGAAEVGCQRGFEQVGAGVGSCLTADADLGGVVIAPDSGVLCAERAVAVVHIIGLARHCDVHSAAVASAAKPSHRSVYPVIPVWVGIEP